MAFFTQNKEAELYLNSIFDLILRAYQNPGGPEHEELKLQSQIMFGLKVESEETFQRATLLREMVWACQEELYNKRLIFDLGICPLSYKDLKIHASSDSVSETNTFLFGFYDELNFLYQIQNLVKCDDSIIDVGANIGCHTLAYSRMVLDGHVYSFEPNKLSVERFQKNCALNNIRNVTLFEELLSDVNGKLPFMDDNNNFNKGVGRVDASSEHFMDCVTLDSHVDDFKGNIKLLKVDVEGHEINVLRGAQEILKQHKPYVVVEYNRDSWKVADLIKTIPYKCVIRRLPYKFYEQISAPIESTDDPIGFVNFLVQPV